MHCSLAYISKFVITLRVSHTLQQFLWIQFLKYLIFFSKTVTIVGRVLADGVLPKMRHSNSYKVSNDIPTVLCK